MFHLEREELSLWLKHFRGGYMQNRTLGLDQSNSVDFVLEIKADDIFLGGSVV